MICAAVVVVRTYAVVPNGLQQQCYHNSDVAPFARAVARSTVDRLVARYPRPAIVWSLDILSAVALGLSVKAAFVGRALSVARSTALV